MPFDFAFRSVASTREIKATLDFLARQDLKYPKYDEWVQRVEAELFSGQKRAALAYSCGVLVGDVIWQPHKQLPRVREIKNLRVSPKARGRYLAQFLLRQAECEDRQDYDALIGDVRENQPSVIRFMQSMGYQAVAKLNLYEENQREVVLFKDCSPPASNSQKFRLPFALIGSFNLSAS